jgi:hypothetical protein
VTAANLFLFRSSVSEGLWAIAADSAGEQLPGKFAPWLGIGVMRPDQPTPHGLPRAAIESGVAANGYQMYRKKPAK